MSSQTIFDTPSCPEYIEARILSAITDSGVPFVATIVARFIGFPVSDVRAAMSSMWMRGCVEQDEDGKFVVAVEGSL